MHDIGKVNHGFQNQAFTNRTPKAGHVSPMLNSLFNDWSKKRELIDALNLNNMVTWFKDEDQLIGMLFSVLCHHGHPVRENPNINDSFWRHQPYDPIAEIRKLVSKFEAWGSTDGHRLLNAAPSFQHAFNGFITLADWIASDDDKFGYSPSMTEQPDSIKALAVNVIEHLGFRSGVFLKSFAEHVPGFLDVSEYSPYPIQQACLDLPQNDEGSITILESDTGSGKTEAVLARFLRMFHAGRVDGLYFALPTRTAAVQLYHRVLAAVNRAFGKACGPPVILAVPGYITVDATSAQARLPDFSVLWPDDGKEKWSWRGWAAENSKRYLAGAISVGTVDQVLLSTLAVRHSQMRATALMRQLLVVDEVHASDAYMTKLLESALDFHIASGGHAFLLSATLGDSARTRYVIAQDKTPKTYEEACNTPYPLVTHSTVGTRRPVEISAHGSGYFKIINICAQQIMSEHDQVAQKAADAARNGARVLVIRNTVKDCIMTQEAFEGLAGSRGIPVGLAIDGMQAPHHSRYAPGDRKTLDKAVESAFGKKSERNGIVCIATQTVEQSLDLDCDIMFSDLCPVDVLLQRIGRLHRHADRQRPEGFAQPCLIALCPEQRDLGTMIKNNGEVAGKHGIGSVYQNLIAIEATWQQIESHDNWKIPTMNRQLVESATHSDALLQIVESKDDKWRQHLEYIRGAQLAQGNIARLGVVDRNQNFDNVYFNKEDIPVDLKTRLGLDDRRVEFEPPVESIFGNTIKELSIPCHMVQDHAETELHVHNVSCFQRQMTFEWASTLYVYDRWGLRIKSAR
jgi:CRISPR-associated endonuclease/helicase Cas3